MYAAIPLLIFSIFLRTTFGCSCVENLWRISRRSTICDGFEREDNIFAATVQTVYCKCLINPNDDIFSCIRYEYVDDDIRVTPQETFSCNETTPWFRYSFRVCSDVTATVTGSRDQSVDPVISPITDLSGEPECGRETDLNYDQGSGCDLTIQPSYYTLNVTQVFKGNYTIGSTITSAGPDVLTSCGNPDAVLVPGKEYLVGIGGACEPISEWSLVNAYTSEDMEFIRQATSDISVCDSSSAVVSSLVSLTVSILAFTLSN